MIWKRRKHVCYEAIETMASALPFLILCSLIKLVQLEITPEELSERLRNDKIVPDVLPFCPVHLMSVKWDNASAYLGNNLIIPEVKFEPTCFWPHEENAFYTLIMTGPDAPNPKNCTQREYQHWIVVNIPGVNVTAGKTLTEYIQPATPIAYGPQRYVFMAYNQPKGNMTFEEPFIPGVPNDVVREKFSTQKFAEKYGFPTPVAINYFRVNWGSYNRS